MKHEIDPKITVKSAIKQIGNKAQIAKTLGISRSVVSDWNEEGLVPPLHAYRLQKLRPDIFEKAA